MSKFKAMSLSMGQGDTEESSKIVTHRLSPKPESPFAVVP